MDRPVISSHSTGIRAFGAPPLAGVDYCQVGRRVGRPSEITQAALDSSSSGFWSCAPLEFKSDSSQYQALSSSLDSRSEKRHLRTARRKSLALTSSSARASIGWRTMAAIWKSFIRDTGAPWKGDCLACNASTFRRPCHGPDGPRDALIFPISFVFAS